MGLVRQACAASGVSYPQLLLPAATLGVVLTIALSLISNYISPAFWEAMARTSTRSVAEVVVGRISRGEPVQTDTLTLYARNAQRIAVPEGVNADAAIGLDRAFTATTGGGLQAYLAREEARDPAYATAIAGASLYLYREIGRMTLVLTGAFSRLEADEALALFPRRRRDNRFSASAAATFRSLALHGFAPLVRLKWERNHSTVELYRYRRRAIELALARAF